MYQSLSDWYGTCNSSTVRLLNMKSTILRSTLLGVCATALLAQTQAPPPQDGGWRRFDDAAQLPPGGQAPFPGQAPPPGQYPNGPAPVYGPPAPAQLTVPAGTWLKVRVNQPISTDHNKTGDVFSATLVQPLIAQGFVVARPGQPLDARVSESLKAGRVKGTSQLAVELTDLTLVDGQRSPVKTELVQSSGGTTVGNDVAAVGTTTGVGAAIGAVAGGGIGAGIGAGAGLGASLIGVLVTRGRPTVIVPEEVLTFKTSAPITISTDAAPQAFQQAQPQDYYEARPVLQRRPPVGAAYYGGLGPYPYPYAYGPYPYYYGPGYYGPGVVIGGRYGRRW